jgi:high-affinity Fe2+/Pb2+ permease
LSTLILRIQQKGLNNKNPNAFIQSIMLGMLLKMFVCVIAVLIYVLISKSGINKNGLLLSMFLYLIYLAVEVSAISKINKQRKNA